MQSGSHKCVSNLAMSEQYNQAGSYQSEFQANFPASPSHPAQPVLTAEHPDVGMFFPFWQGLCTWWQRVCQAWNTFPYNPGMLWSTNVVFGALQELGELLLVKSQHKCQENKRKPIEKKGVLGHCLLDSLLNLGRNGLMSLEFMHLLLPF